VSEGTRAERVAGRVRGAPALLAAIVVVGALLRAFGLSTSLWVDEVDTLLHSVRLPLAQLVTTYASENQHPLYSLLAHFSIALFGEHEWSLRLPALLFGLGSLVAVYRLGARVLDPVHGLLAALFLAVSSHHVWFSQNARGYTGLLFFTLLATTEFVGLLQRPKRRGIARYALFAGLALYLHLTALVVVASHLLVALGPRPRIARDGASERRPAPAAPAFVAIGLGLLLGLLLYLPMAGGVVTALANRAAQSSAAVVRITDWTRPSWALAQIEESFGGGAGGLVVLATFVLLGLVGLVSFWSRARRFLLMHVAALPLALALLLLLHRHLYPRFFFFEAGFVALLLANGAMVAGRRVGGRFDPSRALRTKLAGSAFALLLAAGFSWSIEHVYAHPKQDFTGARDFVESQAAAGDLRVAVGAAKLALPGYYAPAWKSADSAVELAALQAQAPRAWVVWCLPDQLQAAHRDLADAIARDFEVVKELPGTLNGGTVYVGRSR
jgi:4-amino-4-deoxy-L-arabinose transferase-like glycosyltransferase